MRGAGFLRVYWRHSPPGMSNPLHEYRMIVLHIYNISDACGVIWDLLLTEVTEQGRGRCQLTGSCSYFQIRLKMV